jgi:hypothetical protein
MMKKIFPILILFTAVFLAGSLFACQNNNDLELGTIDRSQLNIVRDDEVTVGNIHWKLLDVEEIGPQIVGEYGTLQSVEGRFIYIEFMLENAGQDILQLYDLKVIDSKGRIYSICNEAYGYLSPGPPACVLQEIYPDIERTFNASFDIPLDSVDLILEFTDLKVPPRERVYIDMGL